MYVELKVMLDPRAKMPTLAHDSDAGYDLFSRESRCIYPGCRYSFDTGVHVAIPKGYFGKIESKSGLNAKHGLTCTGVIDSGYTGSIAVILHNGGRDVVQIKKDQKIGQLLIQPVEHPKLVQVDKLEDTERGSGGFGSSGEF